VKALPRNQVLVGDARRVLPTLLPESVDTVLTSPPYPMGVRDYGHPHQLGKEPSITEYVTNLTEVLRLLRSVMKPTASLFLVLGDRFSRSRRQGAPRGSLLLTSQRIALSLLALDFTLRGQVMWQKPNPKPESARNRFSQTYELILFATKDSRGYFLDLDSVRVPHRSAGRAGVGQPRERARRYQGSNSGLGKLKAEGRVGNARGKNPGDVWTIPTATDRSGHQATYPEELAERIITAATPEAICVQCDQPWTRPTRIVSKPTKKRMRHVRKVGELRRCDCRAPVRAGVVLDPFMGTGTTAVVAERLGRDWLGIELNPRFTKLADDRLRSARRAR
jgi:site-specific DNA-methyltransferase (adenine-specific)